MPSKINEEPTDQNSPMEELATLSKQINDCVVQEQWEQLVIALNSRQQCLEALFSENTIEPEILKSLTNSILKQDAIFVEKIQAQKIIIEKQIQDLSKGQQAIQAYGS